MKNLLIIMLCFVASQCLRAQNQVPEINNLVVFADSVNHQLSISFDLADPDSESVFISAHLSDNEGETFLVQAAFYGDIGLTTETNETKTIYWDYFASIPNIEEYRVKIVADDLYEIDIQEIVDLVSQENLTTDLNTIVGVRHYNANPENLQNTKDYIMGVFEGNGLQTSTHNFEYNNNYDGQNLIGKQTGVEDETATIIIDAHYDTVANSPGADDNGTGTVGFLESARVLSQFNFKKNIKFIGFDLEEVGLVGSKEFVANGIDDYETIEAVLNYEMIGYYDADPNTQSIPFGFDILFPEATEEIAAADNAGIFLINVGNTFSSWLSATYDSCATLYVPQLPVVTINAPGNGEVTQDLRRSDHASFWDEGINALMLTDGADTRNPYYHTAQDGIDKINFEFMTNIVKATVATAAVLAEPSHSKVAIGNVSFDNSTWAEQIDGLKQKVYVSPNPNSGAFNVLLRNKVDLGTTVEIVGTNGQLIAEKSIGTKGKKVSFNLQNLASGLYFVKVNLPNGQPLVEKITVGR